MSATRLSATRLGATRKLPGLLAAVATLAVLAGCSSGSGPGEGDGRSTAVELQVFAAASLEAPFTDIADEFTASNPDVTVQFNFAGSSDLVTQISQGAPADVLATANESTMQRAVDFVVEPEPFATNTLTIAVAPGNPQQVRGLADLARDDVLTVICAPQVPCGAATVEVLELAGVTISPASEEPSVSGVLSKVQAREADAGLVYRTDTARADVDAVDFPEADDVVNLYPIAVVKDSEQPDPAADFVEWVRGPEGQRVLAEAGFGAPN